MVLPGYRMGKVPPTVLLARLLSVTCVVCFLFFGILREATPPLKEKKYCYL